MAGTIWSTILGVSHSPLRSQDRRAERDQGSYRIHSSAATTSTRSSRRTTVGAWSDIWLAGYQTRRKSTVRQAEVHLKIIKSAFGAMPLTVLKPSDIKAWTSARKAEGRADSYVYALNSRLRRHDAPNNRT
jgi:hypothetical protein